MILVRHGEAGLMTSRGLIAKMVTQIALPSICFIPSRSVSQQQTCLRCCQNYVSPALSMVILFGIATAVARIFAVRQDRRGLFISMFFNSNTIFVGLPINQALLEMYSLCSDLLHV